MGVRGVLRFPTVIKLQGRRVMRCPCVIEIFRPDYSSMRVKTIFLTGPVEASFVRVNVSPSTT